MLESSITSESNGKSEYYENKIQRLTNEMEAQNQKKNQEMVELFEEIEQENNSLKKELIETKEELDEEKDKINNIKNSIYNFNYYQANVNNSLFEKTTNTTHKINDNNYNSSLYCDNIRSIKEEGNKKLAEISLQFDNSIKNFEINWDSFEKNIKNLLDTIKQMKRNNYLDENAYNNLYNNVINDLKTYNNKINSLLNENYSNKKYSIILLEKLELAKEEISFLKERIIQEKTNILEKINELSHMNKMTHINFAQEIINEINSKRRNYYNLEFYMPLENLHQLLLESRDNEKELNYKIEKLEKDIDDLQYKYEKVNDEKNKLLKEANNYITDKEKNRTNDLLLLSQINKLKKEKEVLENENNSLLRNNNELNQQIFLINNKIQSELSSGKQNNEALVNQKNDLINQLNRKLNDINEKNSKNQMIIDELNNEISKLKIKLNEYIANEDNYRNEIILLKKKLKENDILYKTTVNQTNTLDTINKSYNQKLTNLQTEKRDIENQLNVMNDKYRNLLTEQSRMNQLINDYKSKNTELEMQNQDLNYRITLTDKNNELYSSELDSLNSIKNIIKQIYQNHIAGENGNLNIGVLNMLKEINDKLNDSENSSNNNQLINVNLIYNEDFSGLEQNKNSQLYENILLYLFHIKSQNKIEINKIINNYSESKNLTNNYNQNNIYQILENLKNELDEKCSKFEERIKASVHIDEIEQLVGEIKNLYEQVIDSIMQSFYNHKTDLSANNILTIQLPLDKYHQIINNTNSNLSTIETTILNKINDYKGQGNKIENALNILIENVNNLN